MLGRRERVPVAHQRRIGRVRHVGQAPPADDLVGGVVLGGGEADQDGRGEGGQEGFHCWKFAVELDSVPDKRSVAFILRRS